MLCGLLAAGSAYADAPDTLTPPNGNIIYSPNCTTGGLGTLFGIVIPPNPSAAYQWMGPNGFSTGQQNFTVPDTGWYYLIVTANNCPSFPDSVHVQYFNPPMVEAYTSSPFYCPAEDSIRLSATSNSPLIFWRRLLPNGNYSYIGSGAEAYISGNLLGNVMERILVSTNGAYGCEALDTVTLMRQGIVTPSTPVLDCPGDSLSLSVTGDGAFSWNTGDTTAVLHTIADSASLFAVTVTDANGCTTMGSQAVYIQNGAYVSLRAFPQAICAGDTVLLQAAGGSAYLWENGDTTGSISLALLHSDTIGLTITTPEGCIVDKTITLVAHPLPVAPSVSCDALYESLTYHWIAVPGLAYAAEFLSGPEGQWLSDSSLLASGLMPGQESVLILQVTDSLGCRSSVEARCQTAKCMLEANLEPIGPICLEPNAPSISLSATISGSLLPGQGYWTGTGADSTLATFSPAIAGAGSHQLIYRYIEGPCQVADTLEAHIDMPLSEALIQCDSTPNSVIFNWPQLPQDSLYELSIQSGQTGQALSDTTFLVVGLMPGEAVILQAIAHGAAPCGLVSVVKECRAENCRTASPPTSRLICPGKSVELAPVYLEGAVYQWSPATGLSCSDCVAPIASPDTTTVYEFTITEANGCIRTGSMTVAVGELPDQLLPDTLWACAGQPFYFCLPDEGYYRWRTPQGQYQFLSCLYFSQALPSDAGHYWADVRLPGLCRFEKEFVLAIDESPDCGP